MFVFLQRWIFNTTLIFVITCNTQQYTKSGHKIMSNIFNQQNQILIRFPEQIADLLNEYFQKGGEEPEVTIQCEKRQQQIPRIALQVGINGENYKASVIQLPTVSSTFKTIDRVNFFKSNDVSEMILVHQSSYYDVPESEAEKVMTSVGGTEKVKKYYGQSGVTDATTNIRQRFFRKKPKIDPQLVEEVDTALEVIKSEFTKQDDKTNRNTKKKSNIGE